MNPVGPPPERTDPRRTRGSRIGERRQMAGKRLHDRPIVEPQRGAQDRARDHVVVARPDQARLCLDEWKA